MLADVREPGRGAGEAIPRRPSAALRGARRYDEPHAPASIDRRAVAPSGRPGRASPDRDGPGPDRDRSSTGWDGGSIGGAGGSSAPGSCCSSSPSPSPRARRRPLRAGGFTLDTLESARARALLEDELGLPPSALVLVYSSATEPAGSPAFEAAAAAATAAVSSAPHVTSVVVAPARARPGLGRPDDGLRRADPRPSAGRLARRPARGPGAPGSPARRARRRWPSPAGRPSTATSRRCRRATSGGRRSSRCRWRP